MINNKKQGFTIIETVISMSFITGLLIFIGLVSVRMLHTYRKGISIKTVNQSSQFIIDDFKRSITSSYGLDCFTINNDVMSKSPNCDNLDDDKNTGAGFCTGKYTYIWTYPRGIVKNKSNLKISLGGRGDVIPHLYKIPDYNKNICNNIGSSNPFISLKIEERNNAEDLLKNGDRDLYIYNFKINNFNNTKKKDIGGNDIEEDQGFYNMSFILGTFLQDVDDDNSPIKDSGLIDNSNDKCKPPARLSDAALTDDSYCSINKFNFSARTITGRK